MEYVRTAAPVLVQLFGPDDAGHLLYLTGKLIGMQFFDEVAEALAMHRGSASEFAAFLRALLEAQDDVAEASERGGLCEIRQPDWKLMQDVGDYHRACAEVLRGLVEGLAAGCGRGIGVQLSTDGNGRPPFTWTIG